MSQLRLLLNFIFFFYILCLISFFLSSSLHSFFFCSYFVAFHSSFAMEILIEFYILPILATFCSICYVYLCILSAFTLAKALCAIRNFCQISLAVHCASFVFSSFVPLIHTHTQTHTHKPCSGPVDIFDPKSKKEEEEEKEKTIIMLMREHTFAFETE